MSVLKVEGLISGESVTVYGIDALKCKAEWAKLSEKDQADVYAHLHGHAFDSPSPAKCK